MLLKSGLKLLVHTVFDGGGHFNASGCTIDTKDVEVAKNLVLKEVIKYYG